MNAIAKISCYFSAVTIKLHTQRIFEYSDIQSTSRTLDKKTEQFDIWNAIFYVNLHESYKLLKQFGFLAHPLFPL